MENIFDKYITKMDKKGSCNLEKINYVEKQLNIKFPKDYTQFISLYNGVEGEIGNNGYASIWSIDDLISLNEAYNVNEFALGLIIFGSDGGDTAYAFDFRKKDIIIVEVPFIGMSLETVTICGKNFIEFLEYLHRK